VRLRLPVPPRWRRFRIYLPTREHTCITFWDVRREWLPVEVFGIISQTLQGSCHVVVAEIDAIVQGFIYCFGFVGHWCNVSNFRFGLLSALTRRVRLRGRTFGLLWMRGFEGLFLFVDEECIAVEKGRWRQRCYRGGLNRSARTYNWCEFQSVRGIQSAMFVRPATMCPELLFDLNNSN
jgi:hypothetical protein